MLSCLLAYDATGAVIATLDYCVARDSEGEVIGLLDFEAHETAGGSLTDIWRVSTATGSGTWPEWLGAQAHGFRVERDPQGRIAALVHKTSGHRRERSTVEVAIAERVAAAGDHPADIRDLVGGPSRPLLLDVEGRTAPATPVVRPNLPMIAKRLVL